MSFNAKKHGGWGNGSTGAATNPSGKINSYARVTAISADGRTLTLGSAVNGIFETHAAGAEVLFYASVALGSETEYLGFWCTARIVSVSGSDVTLNQAVTDEFPRDKLGSYACQLVTIPNFTTLSLEGHTLTPLSYDVTNHIGGIVALRCSEYLNAGTGKILTAGGGIPVASKTLRKTVADESDVLTRDFINEKTGERLIMNAGNGVVWVMAKSISLSGATRLGSDTAGKARNEGGEGGASLLLAAQDFGGFDVAAIGTGAVTSGVGKGRAYIATKAADTAIPYDEVLYTVDCLSDTTRLERLGIRSYGNGSTGEVSNPTGQLNSYASVSTVSADGKTLSLGSTATGAFSDFSVGDMVLFHVSACKSGVVEHLGRYCVGKVTASGSGTLTLDRAVTDVIPRTQVTNYICQVVAVPQFASLTLTSHTVRAMSYDASKRCGGILALAVRDLLKMDASMLLAEDAGIPAGSANVSFQEINWLKQSSAAELVPLSAKGGIVFLFAKRIVAENGSRIGASWDGSVLGGTGGMGSRGYPIRTGGAGGVYGVNDGNGSNAGTTGGPGYGGKKTGPATTYTAGTKGYAPAGQYMGTSVVVVTDVSSQAFVEAVSSGGGGGEGGAGGTYQQNQGESGYKGLGGGKGYGGGAGGGGGGAGNASADQTYGGGGGSSGYIGHGGNGGGGGSASNNASTGGIGGDATGLCHIAYIGEE